MPKRKYVLSAQSMQSFLRPLPTDRLLWLIKIAADELADRELAKPRPAYRGEPDAPPLQPIGRTLR